MVGGCDIAALGRVLRSDNPASALPATRSLSHIRFNRCEVRRFNLSGICLALSALGSSTPFRRPHLGMIRVADQPFPLNDGYGLCCGAILVRRRMLLYSVLRINTFPALPISVRRYSRDLWPTSSATFQLASHASPRSLVSMSPLAYLNDLRDGTVRHIFSGRLANDDKRRILATASLEPFQDAIADAPNSQNSSDRPRPLVLILQYIHTLFGFTMDTRI